MTKTAFPLMSFRRILNQIELASVMQTADFLTQMLKNVSTYLILFFLSESKVRIDAPEKIFERHLKMLSSASNVDVF